MTVWGPGMPKYGREGRPKRRTRTESERFWEKVDKRGPEECWVWTAAVKPNGYGHFGGSEQYPHRWTYINLVGPIPKELQIDHLCRNRLCVNPAHLELVTGAENTRRGEKAQRTHCIHGHEFTPENTRIRPNGTRACRRCHALRERRRRAAA